MPIVDAQVHLWQRVMAGAQPQRPHPFGATELLGLMNECGVDRAVLAPTSWSDDGEDGNDIVVQAVMAHPERFRAMGVIAPEDPRSRERLPLWKSRGLVGFCLRFHHPHLAPMLDNGAADWVWPAAQDAGASLAVNAPWHLTRIGEVAARHPDLRIVVDHLGLSRDTHDVAGQVELLTRLAKFDNVVVKADGLITHSHMPYPFQDLHPHICRVLDAFGPRRFFWGSDLTRSWTPGCSLATNYQHAIGLVNEQLTCLSAHDRQLVMGQALCEWIGWI
jgi:predicted TIM-barrel fold metal-dependent hydrolase